MLVANASMRTLLGKVGISVLVWRSFLWERFPLVLLTTWTRRATSPAFLSNLALSWSCFVEMQALMCCSPGDQDGTCFAVARCAGLTVNPETATTVLLDG